jgi:hypothetical protein
MTLRVVTRHAMPYHAILHRIAPYHHSQPYPTQSNPIQPNPSKRSLSFKPKLAT